MLWHFPVLLCKSSHLYGIYVLLNWWRWILWSSFHLLGHLALTVVCMNRDQGKKCNRNTYTWRGWLFHIGFYLYFLFFPEAICSDKDQISNKILLVGFIWVTSVIHDMFLFSCDIMCADKHLPEIKKKINPHGKTESRINRYANKVLTNS